MKKWALIYAIFFMTFCLCTKAQNLVPNYSFEQMIKCTTGDGEFNGYVADWVGQSGDMSSLSYYTHQCPSDSVGGGSVPYNYYEGFQYAHSGVSYGSIATFVTGNPTDTTYPYGPTIYSNNRDYMEAKLIDSLKTGTKYYVTFFVSLMNSSWYSCSDMGAYFSDSALVFNNTSAGLVKSYLVPQVANDPKKQELSDTLNWMKITGNFIAKGREKYIIIGNFKNDSMSSIRYLGQPSASSGEAWYYVDDVIVSPDSNYADSIMGIAQLTVNSEKVKVWPNPSDGKFTVEVKSEKIKVKSIEVYNMLGEKIYSKIADSQQLMADSPMEVNLKGQPEGLYLYRIISEKGELLGSGKLIIQ